MLQPQNSRHVANRIIKAARIAKWKAISNKQTASIHMQQAEKPSRKVGYAEDEEEDDIDMVNKRVRTMEM